MKPELTVSLLCEEAHQFARIESSREHASLVGVTDGKAIGTYVEHQFREYLSQRYSFTEGSSARGIDFPDLKVDMSTKNHNLRQTVEFGDFQTPSKLTDEICHFLHSTGVQPESVIEPTCGTGGFIVSAMDTFEQTRKFFGNEINREYLLALKRKLQGTDHTRIELKNEDFFQLDWENILTHLPQPILLIGNPPWVTNSSLGRIRGSNLPAKSNFQGHKGFDAITGKSNFDISEWMLIHLLDKLQHSTRQKLNCVTKCGISQ